MTDTLYEYLKYAEFVISLSCLLCPSLSTPKGSNSLGPDNLVKNDYTKQALNWPQK